MTLLRVVHFDQGIMELTLRQVMEIQPVDMIIFGVFYLMVTLALVNVLTSMIVSFIACVHHL